MTPDICECGHSRDCHIIMENWCQGNEDTCPCNKFTPQNHSSQVNHGTGSQEKFSSADKKPSSVVCTKLSSGGDFSNSITTIYGGGCPEYYNKDKDADASATPRNSTPNGVSEIIEKVMPKKIAILDCNNCHKCAYYNYIHRTDVDDIIKKALTLQRAEQDKKVKKLDGYFQQGFDDKLGRFILYPTEWKDLKQKVFGAGHWTSSSSQTKEELSSGGTK